MDSSDESALERTLIDLCQRDFPLAARPYAALARHLGCLESEVIAMLQSLRDRGVVGRVGGVWAPGAVGSSCLAALKAPAADLEAVAATVGAHPEVNHNYAREHDWNLWFVVAARDEGARDAVLDAIEAETGLPMLRLPMVAHHHLDLGFPIQWT